MYGAVKHDSVKAIIMFQDAGIVLAEHKSYLDYEDKSLMYTAACTGSMKAIDYLSQQGEDLNSQDQYGYTPLMKAAERGNTKVIDKLLYLGADPSLKDEDGKTYEQRLKIHKKYKLNKSSCAYIWAEHHDKL